MQDIWLARVIYTRGKQQILDAMQLDGQQVRESTSTVRLEIIGALIEIALAACRDASQTPSERARKVRIRRHLRSRS